MIKKWEFWLKDSTGMLKCKVGDCKLELINNSNNFNLMETHLLSKEFKLAKGLKPDVVEIRKALAEIPPAIFKQMHENYGTARMHEYMLLHYGIDKSAQKQ